VSCALWHVDGMVMLLIPSPFFILLWKSYVVGEFAVACWWGDYTHSSISTLHPTLEIIEGELCIVAYWWGDHAHDTICTLHPALEIIGCELCIVAHWWGDYAYDFFFALHPTLNLIVGGYLL